MNPTTPRVHPQQLFVPKLLAQRRVKDAYGGGDELPALAADVGARAAGAHGVVVGHIDIEHELPQQRRERARPYRFPIPGLQATSDRVMGDVTRQDVREQSIWARSRNVTG